MLSRKIKKCYESLNTVSYLHQRLTYYLWNYQTDSYIFLGICKEDKGSKGFD